jgi:hypothetical protein
MHLRFLDLSAEERALFLTQAARQRSLHPAIIEKDFWVCWLLGVLFGQPHLGDHLTFKGGTSLSKVFGIIARFSEDIDLSLAPEFVGIQEKQVERATSRTQRDRWMARLEAACATAVRDRVQPLLERPITETLGTRHNAQPWLEFETDAASQSPVLLFHYPTIQAQGFSYLRRAVKLEFGSLTDQRPSGRHPIYPWVAEELPAGFDDWRCEVVALEAERSFWEKATILHVESHRVAAEPMPSRYSRHYADLAALANHPIAGRALADAHLRQRVVDWKSRFFAQSWAHYELARPGTFRLVPPEARRAALRADYTAMRDMYLGEPLPFDSVISALAELESRINGEASP